MTATSRDIYNKSFANALAGKLHAEVLDMHGAVCVFAYVDLRAAGAIRVRH